MMKMEMFESIAKIEYDEVYYKSQQKDEKELSKMQKIKILEKLYQENAHIFLERYHQFIDPSRYYHYEYERQFYYQIKYQLTSKPNQLFVV